MRRNLIILATNLLLAISIGFFFYFISHFAKKRLALELFYVAPIFSYIIYPLRRLCLTNAAWKNFFLHLMFLTICMFVYFTIARVVGELLGLVVV
ncbi:MAG: hypothetical protein Q7S48_00510 [bacterium]|nr:hypothetical protein [bacterium]